MPLPRRLSGTPLLPVLAVVAVPALLIAWLAPRTTLPRADFVFNNGGEVSSLDPATANGVPEGRVLRALYEGLYVKQPSNLAPVPAMAEDHKVSEDGRIHVFTIRAGARWSNGDPVTAQDFEWNFRRVLEPETGSPFAHELWCIKGARAFNTGLDAQGAPVERDWEKVLVKAADERTLRIVLDHPVPYFLDLLGCWQLSPVHPGAYQKARARWPDTWQSEWVKPDNLIVNGPYKLSMRRINDRMRLVKNPTYWDADNVAFRTIDVLAVEQWVTALNMYLTGEIDWLDGTIPPSLVKSMMPVKGKGGRDDFNPSPYLGSYFYRVNTTRPPLNIKKVRQALSLAIRREVICDQVLHAGQKPCYTLIPWGRIGSYTSPLPTTPENPAGARTVLKAAGFGEGAKEFPHLELLFNTGETHRDIAELIAQFWKGYLLIDVGLRNQEWKSYIDAQQTFGYDLARGSWISDYADPMTFFAAFTSDSENNRTGWKNQRYDGLVAQAATEANVGTRNRLLQAAESILLDELPIIPIYSYVSQNLVDPRLGGFGANLLNDQLPKNWYWMSDSELLRVRTRLPAGVVKTDAYGPREGLYSPAVQRQRAQGGEIAR